MQYFSLRRVTLGAVSLLLLFMPLAYAYDDAQYGYDSRDYDRDYDRNRSDGYSQRADDSYGRQSPSSRDYPPPTAQSQTGYGTPFGVSKSTAGAITGAILGAGTGAIIGSHKGKAGQGAAIGAGLGALGGYMTGRQIEDQDQALDEQDQLIKQQQREIVKNREILNELKRQKLDARETKRGVVVNLPDVLFEFNSHRLTAGARDKVARIASVLKDRAGNRGVSIEGHTDAIGSEAYNQALSERRAESVTRELAYDGVHGARLATRGFGERYPIAPNTRANGSDDPRGRAKNRRVEVVIEN
jgi:outer membrane protein OmpA-like peptidoglycan-associated protein